MIFIENNIKLRNNIKQYLIVINIKIITFISLIFFFIKKNMIKENMDKKIISFDIENSHFKFIILSTPF
jgi:hypothetical protein